MTLCGSQLKQIDGETTNYLKDESGAIVGACPGCFLRYRKKHSVKDAEAKSRMVIVLPIHRHLGCGVYTLIGRTWAPNDS